MSRSWNASGGSQVGGGLVPTYHPRTISRLYLPKYWDVAHRNRPDLSLSLFLCLSLSLRGSNLGQPNDSIPCLLTEDTSRWNRVARGLFALGGAMIFSRIHVHVFRSHRCIVILLKRFFRKRSSIGLSLSNNKMSFLVFKIYLNTMIFEFPYVLSFISPEKSRNFIIRISWRQFNLFILTRRGERKKKKCLLGYLG